MSSIDTVGSILPLNLSQLGLGLTQDRKLTDERKAVIVTE